MALKFKNRDSLPATPKSWTVRETGYKIPFDSVRSTFDAFLDRVMQYYDANNLPRPAIPEIEDHICHQISSWACTGEAEYRARQSVNFRNSQPNYVGCKACGVRKA